MQLPLVPHHLAQAPPLQAAAGADDLNARGHKTKVQNGASGPHRGGCAFRRGTLYHMLANPIYLGHVVHKGETYPGEHEPIVPLDLWQAVQDKLKANASGSARRIRGQQPSLLTGLLKDSHGRAMTPSHASKGKAKRYRYYVTRSDQAGDEPAYRVSAHDLEKIVTDRLAQYLAAPGNIAALTNPETEALTLQRALGKADLAAATLRSGSAKAKHELITQLLGQATLHDTIVELELSPQGLAELLGLDQLPAQDIQLSVAATRTRKGHQIRLVIEGVGSNPPSARPAAQPKRDEKLVVQLAQAWQARRLVLDNPHLTLAEIAAQQVRCRKHLAKLVEMSCVTPEELVAIVGSHQRRQQLNACAAAPPAQRRTARQASPVPRLSGCGHPARYR